MQGLACKGCMVDVTLDPIALQVGRQLARFKAEMDKDAAAQRAALQPVRHRGARGVVGSMQGPGWSSASAGVADHAAAPESWRRVSYSSIIASALMYHYLRTPAVSPQ